MSLPTGVRIEIAKITGGTIGAYTKLDKVGAFNIPAAQADEHEVTNHDTPAGEKDFLPGRKDRGELSFPIVHVPDSDTAELIEELHSTNETVMIRITTSSRSEPYLFTGFVRTVEITQDPNAPVEMTVGIRLGYRVEDPTP